MVRAAERAPRTARAFALIAAVGAWLTAPALAAAAPTSQPGTDDLRPSLSKKEEWLVAKARAASGAVPPEPPALRNPGIAPAPVISLFNVWTDEVLPIVGDTLPTAVVESQFLRCHFTGRSIAMAAALLPAVLSAAHHFNVSSVQIVSGYRSAKYNLFLHKKCHQVAKDSQHILGHAIDFRLPGIDTWTLREYVRSLHLGGVGYYPVSEFVHCDVGPIRFWQGD